MLLGEVVYTDIMPTPKNGEVKLEKGKAGRPKGSLNGRRYNFTALDGIKYTLTQRQRAFAELFTKLDGNGVDAIIEAGYQCYYPNSKIPNRKAAAVIASVNLKKVNVSKYIEKIYEDIGLNNPIVDKHHLFNITQFADLGAKNKAIDMYNRKRSRYAPEEHKHVIEKIEVVNYGKTKK